MSQKIAVAVIHGVGSQGCDFAESLIDPVKDRFHKLIGAKACNSDEQLVVEPVYWAPVLETEEKELLRRVKREADLGYGDLRQFMVSFAADAIAYQPVPKERAAYDDIHAVMAKSLKHLARMAGPTAPLCIVAHSLGTIIACNYMYDLLKLEKGFMAQSLRDQTRGTPLERGETFAAFYTFGSPIALWSLRFDDFGTPIEFPSSKLHEHQPSLTRDVCKWINFFNRNDILAYPLKTLNDAYGQTVSEDREVSVGGWLSRLTPLSHTKYWAAPRVTKPIADGLAKLWKAVNP